MSMGVFTNEYMVDLKERMPLEERRRVEQLAKEIMADNAKAQAETEVKANEIASIKESINKTEEDAVQERKTEEVDVAEEARTGEGVVEEDQEAKAPEEAPTEESKKDPYEGIENLEIKEQADLIAEVGGGSVVSQPDDRIVVIQDSNKKTPGVEATYEIYPLDENGNIDPYEPKYALDVEKDGTVSIHDLYGGLYIAEKSDNLIEAIGRLEETLESEGTILPKNVINQINDIVSSIQGEQEQEAKAPEEAPTEERINATNLEEAQKLHEQGYRPEIEGKVDEEATVAEIANYLNTRPSVEMVKKGVAKEAPAGTRLFSEPNPETVDIARKYKEEKGIDTPEGEPFRELDTEKSKRISDAYEAMEHNPNDPEVKEAYQAMADETMEQHKSITDAGYTFEIWEGKGEPYANSQEMIDDVRNNKHMYILSTEKDFGDTPITEQQRTENPLLKDSGVKDVNGKPLLINDVFRGVHDFFGHTERGNSFGAKGEENAWDVHARMYSDKARRAMTTETRGQNSYVNFSGVNDAANAKFKQAAQLAKEGKTEEANRLREEARSEMSFAEQKIGLLPEEFSQIEEKYTKKQKTLGEKIRKGKIDDDIAMSGIPGFKQAWNAVVEVTAATVDTIDGIIQKVKESDWYKGLKESDRRKADKVLDKEREKIVKAAIEESTGVKKTKADKKAYTALKSQVNNAKTKEEIADAQQTLIDYAREVLPKFKKYTQTEVTAMMNRVKRATSSTGLKNALDAIDKKAFNFKEETRKKSVERIKKRFKDPQEKKKTGTLKTSKIGVDASRKIEALRQEVADKIDNMTQNQLDKLESKLENIIAKGKEAVIAREAARQEKKRKDRLVPLRELVKLNEKSTKRKGAIDESKISEKEGESIIEFLRDRDGFVVYDEQVFTGKTDFERYLKSKNETIDSIGPVEAFETTATREEAKKIYQERRRNRIKDAARTVTKDSLSPTLQNKLDRLSSGSAALYRWIEKNIKKPLADAEYDTEVGRHEKQKRLGNIMKDIFGKNILNWQTMTRLPNSWTKKAPIEIGRNKKKVTNGKILTYYMSARTQAKPIYKVGEKYYVSPAETKKAADNAGIPYSSVEDFMYTNKYNPEVIKEMSTSLSDKLENGLKKMEEINEYVEVKNPKLKQVEEKFQEFLQDMKNSDEFGGIYETLFDSEFSEGYYFPIRRSIISEIQASDVLKESNNNHGSAMADSLRQRVNNPKAPLNLDVDAYTIMLNYANTMEHAKNFLPVTDNVRNLVNEKSVPEIIKKIGSNGFFELNTQLLRVLTDGETRPRQNKALGGLSKWTVVTTLMAKTGSIPKQLTSQFHYYGAGIIIGVPVYKVVWQAMKILPNAPVRGASALYNWAGGNSIPSPSLTSKELDVVKGFLTSPYIIDRLKGTSIDVETRSIINGLQGATHKNIARVITQILMSPTIVGDVGGVVMGGVPLALAVYNTKKKIMPHKEALDYAIRFAIEVTKDTQQSQSDRVLSNAQVDPWYRAMLQYRTSQTAVAANTIKGIHMLKNWKGYAPENIDPNSSAMKNWMDKTRPLRAGVFKSIYFPIFGNAVFNAIAGGTATMIYLALKGTDDEERRKELMRTALYNLVADDVSSDLQGYGLPGWLIDAQLNSLRNRGYFNNIPVIKAMIGSGKEPGIISGLEIPYVQSYKGAWDLYQEGEINFHDIFDAYEDVDEKARIDVFKNFSNGVESWTQWAESEGEDKMTWWDAFMNRRLDEEGRMFKTARERDDWLFQQIFPKEDERFPQFSPDFQKKLEKSIDGSSTFNKLDDFEKWINEPDISTIEKTIRPSEPSESGYGGLKYEAAKEKQKKRYKSKISKERAANVQQEEINRLYAPSGMKEALKGMRIADPEKSVKTKPEPESADVFLENIRKEYIRVVGKEPSKDATLSGMLKEIESKKQ
jgi:hypothetical protein